MDCEGGELEKRRPVRSFYYTPGKRRCGPIQDGSGEKVTQGRSSLGCILELTGLPHGLEMEQEVYRETKDDDAKISGVNSQLVAQTEMVWQAERLPKCLHHNLREL